MAEGAKAAQKILEQVLALAKKAAPTADCIATLESGRSANTRFARSEITSTGDVDETTVSVEVALGRRHAETTTNQTDVASLGAAVEAAVRLAAIAPEDPEWLPPLGAQKYLPAPAAYDAATDKLGAEVRAAAAQRAIAAGEAQKLQVAGFYEHAAQASALATSAGARAYRVATWAEYSTTVRTDDGTGSGWASAYSPRAGDIDATSVTRVAVDKAVRSARPRRLDPGRYTVILEPAAVGELLSFLASSLDARSADEGRSFFSRPGGGTRVGEKIFPDRIQLRSDPTDPSTPGATFDGDGVPLQPITWIDKGTVAALAYSRFWASKQGKSPTGRHQTWQLAGGEGKSAADLLAGVKRGVLITRFWYTRYVDPQTILITGLTRDGTFLIENGQVTAPVNNFRFNESPVTMLAKADLLTATTERLDSRWRVPALRTQEFNLASISEAV